MVRKNGLQRRALLGTLGGVAVGSVGVQATSGSQDRDPTEYDRPRTVSEGNVSVTKWDCSRGIFDAPPGTELSVTIHYIHVYWGDADEQSYFENRDFEVGPSGELDLDVNEHVSITDLGDDAPRTSPVTISRIWFETPDGSEGSIDWPNEEWDCREMREQNPPTDVSPP